MIITFKKKIFLSVSHLILNACLVISHARAGSAFRDKKFQKANQLVITV